MLQEKLGLSDDQTAELEAIFADKSQRGAKHEAIKGILTPDQLAQFEEMKGKRGHGGKHGMRGFMKDPQQHAARMQEKLGLTDDQAAQLEAVFADKSKRGEKHEAIKGILTPDQLAELEKMRSMRGHDGQCGCDGQCGMK